MYEIAPSEFKKGKKLAITGVSAPVILTAVPGLATFILMFMAAGGPPVAAVIFFVGAIITFLGFFAGLAILGVMFQRRAAWTRDMRERIAADGIKAEEISWFRNELKPNEKRGLKSVEARDLLLADAYRETLASRLTATRIIKSSKRELSVARQRQNSLKQLKSSRSNEFQTEIDKDIAKISRINDEAKNMLIEAESRLQMIEAAASRQGGLADSELALKKLSARSAELPLALESAKMSEEIWQELEKEDGSNDPGNGPNK